MSGVVVPIPPIEEYPERYQYRFCPRDGTPLQRGVIHDMERLYCPACSWVFYPTHNIASTVVIEYQGGIVLTQRATEPDKGIWHLPIGHTEFGESPEAAAIRESWEETGLEIDHLQFLVYEHSLGYGDPRMWYIVFGFMGRAVGGELTTSAETSDIQVVSLADMPELKWTSQRKTLAAYRTYIQGHV